MKFADLHIHALPGVDDGAQTDAACDEIIRKEYRDGVRIICFTPHYHPGFFRENGVKRNEAFERIAQKYRAEFPDLQLFLRNELRYSPEAVNWLRSGKCLTLNGTRTVLVDFDELEEYDVVLQGLRSLLNSGFQPILAHAERYARFHLNLREIEALINCGVLIQVDAQSVLGDFGWRSKWISNKILKENLAYLVASDAHDCVYRSPKMLECYNAVIKKAGVHCADRLFYYNALDVLELKN